ncbi:glycosyltransferase family 2 protein [Puniceibacterium sediminis]|uniref:Glycosyl transferase family 2 n=1 Tax=Puniceibacterium sediminis TaxID=1608407 RepID=A0A238WJP7_9RHOB|nr:glycosyltransferase family 2 protein [Puniceibacterium sediminis]SNR46792.1 Glycosyl transferase family 2 [Puniceibacterium sediminis]
MQRLERISEERHDPCAMPIVALAHNERNILPDFLAHYRSLCAASFFIVDDHSTDGSRAYLAAQPDVTLFQPVAGAEFLKERAIWKSGLLDHYGSGKWCMAPDIDEHFVWPGMPDRSLAQYISALESEGAEAVASLMIDMYGDLPLSDHVHDPEDGVSLHDRFPLFDGPGPFPLGYFMRPISAAQSRERPTPPVRFNGGARDRLFFLSDLRATRLQSWLIERYLRMDQRITPTARDMPMRMVARQLTRHLFENALNATKVGLFRWQRGMMFNGHKVDRRLVMSESVSALLHFPFTRGQAGIEYIVNRGQHAGGSRYYRKLLESGGLSRSPITAQSLIYEGSQSLGGLIRDVPDRG